MAEHMDIAAIAVTDSSEKTAHYLASVYPGKVDVYRPAKGALRGLTAELFPKYKGLVFIAASGIVVRMIAPLIDNKYEDPAIVTVDDARRFAISTLSGHEGGANFLTWKIASLLGCQPVITTASDTNRRIIMGVGCRKGIEKSVVTRVVQETLMEMDLKAEDIRCAATLDAKKGETGLLKALDEMEIGLQFLSPEEIGRYKLPEVVASDAPMKHFGVPGVAEPCALIIGQDAKLIMNKKKDQGVTIALAEETICPIVEA